MLHWAGLTTWRSAVEARRSQCSLEKAPPWVSPPWPSSPLTPPATTWHVWRATDGLNEAGSEAGPRVSVALQRCTREPWSERLQRGVCERLQRGVLCIVHRVHIESRSVCSRLPEQANNVRSAFACRLYIQKKQNSWFRVANCDD